MHESLAQQVVSEGVPKGLLEQYEKERPVIEQLYSMVDSWQGTGRYQYREGQVVDILGAIIDAGGLAPQLDIENMITSTTKNRPYAGVYADVHQYQTKELQYQYHDSVYWAKRIRNSSIKKGWRSLGSFKPFKARKMALEWLKKRTHRQIHNPLEYFKLYETRSDIPNNYGILIGIREVPFQPIPASEFISAHENQYDKLIPLSYLHIEVPLTHLAETESFLRERNINIPIIAREMGEIYSCKFSEDSLIHGNPFRKRSTV